MKITRRTALGMALASIATSLVGSRAQASGAQIIRLSKIKVGATFQFQLSNGAPALLFRTKTGVFAYQTICTHQGGLTKYFSPKKLLVCSVHNASFDPFKKGAVVTGPATEPLPTVKVAIKNGWVVLA
ncbi:MAG: Rieske 2Fe-2S domain-containing protein [Actinomycetales bacterium]|jgi:nitrite reductase/ring-hydroxylating ferredoxin subunit|nr:Rieske 2Fe-2S domain-containing protein [Actinomycetales bacterium]